MPESTEEWMRRIGCKEAMEHRRSERLAGRMNAPLRGVRGLANVVGRMTGAFCPHRVNCNCEKCQPWLHQKEENPVVKLPSPKDPKQRRKPKWTQQRGRSGN